MHYDNIYYIVNFAYIVFERNKKTFKHIAVLIIYIENNI